MNAREINAKGLTVYGCWHWNHLQDTQPMMGTIRGAKSLLDKMITHTFPFSQVQQALETRAATSVVRSSFTRGRTDSPSMDFAGANTHGCPPVGNQEGNGTFSWINNYGSNLRER